MFKIMCVSFTLLEHQWNIFQSCGYAAVRQSSQQIEQVITLELFFGITYYLATFQFYLAISF